MYGTDRVTAFGPAELALPRLVLRPAVPSDEPFGRSTHHCAYRDVIERQFGSFDLALQDEFFARTWAKPGFVIVVCGGDRAGFARFEPTTEALVVHELVLLPAFQGVGFGTEILGAAQAWAAPRHLPLTLQVLRLNRAVRLYSRLGFQRLGEDGSHIRMRWHPDPAAQGEIFPPGGEFEVNGG